MTSRLLFVCAGSTCRSPIAAALTAILVPGVSAECAGMVPGYAVAQKAVAVVFEMTALDISDHVPRDLYELDLERFDRIVAMDRFVAEEIASTVPPEATFDVWDVPDPYGGSMHDYRRCAETLRAYIQELSQ